MLPSEQLARMRAQTKAAGILKDLKELAAAWEEVAKKCDLACEEMVKLRLDVERDLGAQLAQCRQTWPCAVGQDANLESATAATDWLTRERPAVASAAGTRRHGHGDRRPTAILNQDAS